MTYKREELDYIAAQLIPVILEKLGVEAQGVSEVEIVSDLTGVFSLPAYKKVGGVEKVVEAPVTLLQDIALDTVKEATDNAKAATGKATAATVDATTQADRAKDLADHPTMMGENGNWWKWDATLKKYVDTGILAKGGVLYPTFYIDPDTMELIMSYQDEIVADMFNIDNEGNLTFNPK